MTTTTTTPVPPRQLLREIVNVEALGAPAGSTPSAAGRGAPHRYRFAGLHVGDLADADIAVEQFEVTRCRKHADGASRGMADERDLVLAESPGQRPRELAGIVDDLVEARRGDVAARPVRLAGTALVPVHDDERRLERLGVPLVRGQLRRARAAVDEQHDRGC